MDIQIIIFRVGLTFLLAMIFGLYRQKSHKPIGFGTFSFVAVGAAVLGVIAMDISPEEPLGLLAAIVTGIGFLGAGALIRGSDRVFGFTSAASIWIIAIFGLSMGIGELFLGGLIYCSLIIVNIVDEILEIKGIGTYQKRIIVVTNKIIDEKEVRKNFDVNKCEMDHITINKKENKMIINYILKGKKEDLLPIPLALYGKPWFESMRIE